MRSQALLVASGVHASAARTPRKFAVLCDGRSRTYSELSERARRISALTQIEGWQKGDRIALLSPNCIEYPEIVCGLSDAGIIVVTLNPRSSAAEIRAACDDCGARAILVHPLSAGIAPQTGSRTLEKTIVIDSAFDYQLARIAPASEGPIAQETDPFALVYSSGTTGRPKGILISHRARALLFYAMAMEYGCYGPDDLQLGLAPMAHGAGFAFIMATLWFGGTVDILTQFDPERVLNKLSSEPFTGVFMVPTHFHAIFSLGSEALEAHRKPDSALRTIISNAAALPQSMKETIVEYWGESKLHESYGSTEAGIVSNLRPADQLTRKQSVGRPFATNWVALLDDNLREVAANEVGELYSRSPYLFEGYFDQPGETAAVSPDGWVTAGDLARRDDEGFIYIVDRKKDVLISGGVNIYPSEIELALAQHPETLEAAVIGVPDDRWGERPRAFVVRRPGATVSAEALVDHCKLHIGSFKVPRDIRFLESLPRNQSGKLLKKALRELP